MGDAWARVSAVAADRFLAEGYAAVSLRALGEDLGMKPASLYHHCPAGKSELFVRSVTERLAGVEARARAAGDRPGPLAQRLVAVGEALLDAPPMDLQRLLTVDLERLRRPEDRQAVSAVAHDALLRPFRDLVAAEQAAGRARAEPAAELVAASAVAIVTNLGQLHLRLAGPSARPAVSQQVAAALGLLARGLQP